MLTMSAGCGAPSTNRQPPPPLGEISFGFEEPLEAWIALGGSGEAAKPGDIQRSTTYAREGGASVCFRVNADSQVAKGTRAELTLDPGHTEGSTVTYAWSLLIPEDYPDVPLEDAEGEPNWQVMGQWHQKPDLQRGETWDKFPGQGESPPVGFVYLRLREEDPNFQRLRQDPRSADIQGFNPDWTDQTVLLLTCGTPPLPVACVPVRKGKWIDLKVEIRWSTKETGQVQAWVNGNKLNRDPFRGPNMWNHSPHYFKFGLYRNPDILSEQRLYYDRFSYFPGPAAEQNGEEDLL